MQVQCDITLGIMLTTIYEMSRKQYGNKPAFYAAFWGGYHRAMSDKESMEWLTSQSTVSMVMRSMHDLPDDQYRYYTDDDGDDHLRMDVQRHIRRAVRTCRQHADHYNQLLNLVEGSINLDPGDMQYILAYVYVDADLWLEELMYRMLYVLIREPNDVTK